MWSDLWIGDSYILFMNFELCLYSDCNLVPFHIGNKEYGEKSIPMIALWRLTFINHGWLSMPETQQPIILLFLHLKRFCRTLAIYFKQNSSAST